MKYLQENSPGITLRGFWSYFFIILFIFVVVGLSLAVFTVTRDLVANAPIDVLDDGNIPGLNAATGDESALTEEELAAVNWNEGQVTILLMGIDERKFETGPARTDSLILLTIDPVTMHAGMLSVPRDLWVEIPNVGVYDKINTAYFRGVAEQYPGGGGPALAADTIQHNLGIKVDYFVTVNFQAFVDIIDEIGCIPVTVPQTIDDPNYPAADGYGVDPFYLDAGEYCMGGETLLRYARTRATYGGDFDRSARQQQVINAVREYVLSSGQLTSLLAKAPQIYATASEGITTDLSLQQGIALARLGTEIASEDICSVVLNGSYVDLQKLPDGTDILIPIRSAIRQLLADLWNGTGRCAPDYDEGVATAVVPVETPLSQPTALSTADPTAQPTGVPTIGIFNGTETGGLASSAAALIRANGIEVTFVGNSDLLIEQTVVMSYRGYDVQAIALANILGIPVSAVQAGSAGRYDIEVMLGADYSLPGS